MADYPISNVPRRVVYSGSAGVGPYAFTFEVLASSDIAVYKNTTLLTVTTHYTVTVNSNGTGSVTLTSAATSSDRITIVGARAIERTSDFVTGGDFFANTVNTEMDSQIIFVQQVAETAERGLKAPVTDPTTINMTLPINTARANKTLAFDSNGNPVVGDSIGNYRGNWAASTLYYLRDIARDDSNGNVYICTVEHTSSGTTPISSNADSAKWSIIVDAETAGDAATDAAASAALANDWATKTSGTVAGGEYSAKYHAQAAATSASAASSSASSASTSASNAASSASSAASSASSVTSGVTTASEWASKTDGQVASTDYSAKAWSIGGTGVSNTASRGAAKEWAVKTSGTVDGTSYSAKYHADAAATSASSASSSASSASGSASSASSSASSASSSASAASTSATNASNSASAASTSATNASNSAGAASTSASNAASSASAAASSASDAATSASAAAASYDAFDDRYLGAKSSNPTVDNDGNALLTGAIYWNTAIPEMRVYNGSAWVAVSTTPDTIVEVEFLATAGQTSYTFSGGYRVGFVYVLVNGVMLGDSDITATDGSTITFSALALNDVVRVITFKAIASVTASDVGAVAATSATGSGVLPSGTTAQRDASPAVGYIRYNTTTAGFEGYSGSGWGAIGGGGGATKLLVTNRSASTVEVPLTSGYLAVTNRAGSTVNVSVS